MTTANPPKAHTGTFIVTRRSKNLGIGWTNQPVQERDSSGQSRLVIADVDAPEVVGRLADVAKEFARARRLNSGNDWRAAFFVGGVKVDREQFLHAMEWLRTRHVRGRDEGRGPVRKWESDAETVMAVGSEAIADLNRAVAASIDAEDA